MLSDYGISFTDYDNIEDARGDLLKAIAEEFFRNTDHLKDDIDVLPLNYNLFSIEYSANFVPFIIFPYLVCFFFSKCLSLQRCALDDFKTHSAVVVRTLPETGLVLCTVDASVRKYAPIPLAVFLVKKMSLDIFPAMDRILKAFLSSEMLPEVEVTHSSLSLHPPVTVIVDMVAKFLIYHSSFRCEALCCSSNY